jgi:hypothetical protein
MRVFRGLAFLIMAAFFVWLLLQMSRTPLADRRLVEFAVAFLCIAAALGVGALPTRRR